MQSFCCTGKPDISCDQFFCSFHVPIYNIGWQFTFDMKTVPIGALCALIQICSLHLRGKRRKELFAFSIDILNELLFYNYWRRFLANKLQSALFIVEMDEGVSEFNFQIDTTWIPFQLCSDFFHLKFTGFWTQRRHFKQKKTRSLRVCSPIFVSMIYFWQKIK